MQTQVYEGFTNNFVKRAIAELKIIEMIKNRVVDGNVDDTHVLKQSNGCLIVLKPMRWEPEFGHAVPTQAFVDKVVAAVIMFGAGDVKYYYNALGKAHLSFYWGEASDRVVMDAVKLQIGACRWGGSFITDTGLVVAYSGGTQAQDLTLSVDVATALEDYADEAYQETVVDDMSIAFLGYHDRMTPWMPDIPRSAINA